MGTGVLLVGGGAVMGVPPRAGGTAAEWVVVGSRVVGMAAVLVCGGGVA
ncbi:hypothetical protein [Actinokineospora terrae]|uniref:Uncharacterized protein n=1 Tax=Actinokineospora terrae TaxID=155974 RepID=A0A1H9TLG6_9PSEU|nr:hypothetical protein [Actinokineospora terrae]SER97976.1 hypothetical protein SAMN04487818_106347 [Actinokineospora terrae]